MTNEEGLFLFCFFFVTNKHNRQKIWSQNFDHIRQNKVSLLILCFSIAITGEPHQRLSMVHKSSSKWLIAHLRYSVQTSLCWQTGVVTGFLFDIELGISSAREKGVKESPVYEFTHNRPRVVRTSEWKSVTSFVRSREKGVKESPVYEFTHNRPRVVRTSEWKSVTSFVRSTEVRNNSYGYYLSNWSTVFTENTVNMDLSSPPASDSENTCRFFEALLLLRTMLNRWCGDLDWVK